MYRAVSLSAAADAYADDFTSGECGIGRIRLYGRISWDWLRRRVATRFLERHRGEFSAFHGDRDSVGRSHRIYSLGSVALASAIASAVCSGNIYFHGVARGISISRIAAEFIGADISKSVGWLGRCGGDFRILAHLSRAISELEVCAAGNDRWDFLWPRLDENWIACCRVRSCMAAWMCCGICCFGSSTATPGCARVGGKEPCARLKRARITLQRDLARRGPAKARALRIGLANYASQRA